MATTYKFTPITEKEYSQLLKKASYTTFYNSPERISFIQKRNRKSGMYKIEANDSTVGLINYQIIPAKSGPFVYFQHSPLFIDTRVAEDPNFWQQLKTFAVEIGSKAQAVYVRFTPRILSTQTIVSDIISAGFRRAPVQELDACVTRVIAVPQFDIKNLRNDLASAVERAQKKGLTVTFETTPTAVEDFVSIYRTLAAKKQIDFVPVDYLKDELKAYCDASKLLIAKVHDEKGVLYASAAIVIDGDNAWYYWAATTDQGKEIGADTLLLAETLPELVKRKVKILDMWGGSVSKEIADKALPHPWKELDQFRQGFGASLVEYLPAIDLPVRTPLYLAAVFYQRALMTKRGYPYVPLKA